MSCFSCFTSQEKKVAKRPNNGKRTQLHAAQSPKEVFQPQPRQGKIILKSNLYITFQLHYFICKSSLTVKYFEVNNIIAFRQIQFYFDNSLTNHLHNSTHVMSIDFIFFIQPCLVFYPMKFETLIRF